MFDALLNAAARWLPRAVRAVDRFHVAKDGVAHMDEARRRGDAAWRSAGTRLGRLAGGSAGSPPARNSRSNRWSWGPRTPRAWRPWLTWRTSAGAPAARRGTGTRRPASDLDDLTPKPRAPKCGIVDALIEWDHELKVAYQLLQRFYAWSDTKRRAEKRDGLEEWCKLAMQSGIPEFKTVAKTFRKYREGILNG